MIFRPRVHLSIDKTVPPGKDQLNVRYAHSPGGCARATHGAVALLVILAIVFGGLIHFSSHRGAGKIQKTITTIANREKNTLWGTPEEDAAFLHEIQFTNRLVKAITEEAELSGKDVSAAYKEKAEEYAVYLRGLLSGRTHTRILLYTFCGFQLFFSLVAMRRSITTGNLVGKRPENSTSKLWQAARNMAGFISDQSSSLITMVGICGTFAGLVLGLWNMKPSPAGTMDLQPLFISLSISFISSLSGIVVGIATRLFQNAFETPPCQNTEDAATNGSSPPEDDPSSSAGPEPGNGPDAGSSGTNILLQTLHALSALTDKLELLHATMVSEKGQTGEAANEQE